MQINQAIIRTTAAPIAQAAAWPSSRQKSMIDLAQAVPSYDPAPELLNHLSTVAGQPASAFYTDILGLAPLRDALAGDLAEEYGAPIQLDNIAITTGCNHAFCMASAAVAGVGDEIILPEPFYFNHDMWFTMQGIKKVTLPCHPRDEGMVPDPEEARALISPKTRAIVLISPNNPTGTIYSEERLTAFYDLAAEFGLALILDETYKDFRPLGEDPAPHKLFQRDGWEDVLIQLYSFSKAYSLTGYRVGSLTAGSKAIAAITKIADTMTICPPHIGQLAALYGLKNLKAWREEKRNEMLELQKAFDAAFLDEALPYDVVSRGAFFAYLRHLHDKSSSIKVAQQLKKEKSVLLLPGEFFGQGQRAYLRAAFANATPHDLASAAERLKEE